MRIDNINTSYTKTSLSFSGKREVAGRIIQVVRSPHIVSQAASQLLAPFIFNCDFSKQTAIRIKILGDIVDAICNLCAKKRISIKAQPTSFISITVSGIRKTSEICKKYLRSKINKTTT